MKFIPSKELISDAFDQGYAIPSFCVWNAETMQMALTAAAELKSPVMLMSGPSELTVFRPKAMANIARAIAREFNVCAALHLDHGDTPQLADEAIAAGFTSVMLDYSTRPYAENAAALKELVTKCKKKGITVEGELGSVGKVDQATKEGGKTSTLTVPAEAKQYVEETGVDILAVSIGNAHGLYTARPTLEFGLLAELKKATGIPLVLHGGSGTPEEDLKKAISLGMAKINVASELCKAVRDSFEDQWKTGRNKWLPEAFAETKSKYKNVAERWIRMTGAAGKSAGCK